MISLNNNRLGVSIDTQASLTTRRTGCWCDPNTGIEPCPITEEGWSHFALADWGQTLGGARLKQVKFGRRFTLEHNDSRLVSPDDLSLHRTYPDGTTENSSFHWKLIFTFA